MPFSLDEARLLLCRDEAVWIAKPPVSLTFTRIYARLLGFKAEKEIIGDLPFLFEYER